MREFASRNANTQGVVPKHLPYMFGDLVPVNADAGEWGSLTLPPHRGQRVGYLLVHAISPSIVPSESKGTFYGEIERRANGNPERNELQGAGLGLASVPTPTHRIGYA
jgi:hypothetical protein